MHGVSPSLSRIKWTGDLCLMVVTSNSMTNPQVGFHMTLTHNTRYNTMNCCTTQRFIKKYNFCYKSFRLKWNVLNVQTVRTVSQLYDK